MSAGAITLLIVMPLALLGFLIDSVYLLMNDRAERAAAARKPAVTATAQLPDAGR